MDSNIFEIYWTFSHTNVRKMTSDSVCLILENCPAHGDQLPNFPGVEFLFLSLNVAAVYQPLDLSVLIALKTKSRNNLLLRIVSNLERYDELWKLSAKQRDEMRGIDYCYPEHVLDAVCVMCESFSDLLARQ